MFRCDSNAVTSGAHLPCIGRVGHWSSPVVLKTTVASWGTCGFDSRPVRKINYKRTHDYLTKLAAHCKAIIFVVVRPVSLPCLLVLPVRVLLPASAQFDRTTQFKTSPSSSSPCQSLTSSLIMESVLGGAFCCRSCGAMVQRLARGPFKAEIRVRFPLALPSLLSGAPRLANRRKSNWFR
jgi:hypothetical protein